MPQVIAYPGTAGSFSHAAARQVFPQAQCVGYATFPEAARACMEGQADYVLLPVENSFAGAVLPTYSLLEKLPLHIVGETLKLVTQNLLVVPGARLSDIRVIASHPQAIAQCDDFLQGLPGVQIVPSANTAISARDVARKGDPAYAAIASVEAADEYGLEVLCRNIQTSKHNTTRFFILSKYPIPLTSPNKATVVFTVNNQVGALVEVLASFARSGLNMSRIESRPLPETTFQYFFSADFEGEMDAAHLRTAMEAARPCTCDLRLLGVYGKGTLGNEDFPGKIEKRLDKNSES